MVRSGKTSLWKRLDKSERTERRTEQKTNSEGLRGREKEQEGGGKNTRRETEIPTGQSTGSVFFGFLHCHPKFFLRNPKILEFDFIIRRRILVGVVCETKRVGVSKAKTHWGWIFWKRGKWEQLKKVLSLSRNLKKLNDRKAQIE
jgi:hypothetical protein